MRLKLVLTAEKLSRCLRFAAVVAKWRICIKAIAIRVCTVGTRNGRKITNIGSRNIEKKIHGLWQNVVHGAVLRQSNLWIAMNVKKDAVLFVKVKWL